MTSELPKNWKAEQVQVTLFSQTPSRVSVSSLYSEAFGEDAIASNETINPQFGRQGAASSAAKNGMVRSIQVQTGRCDFFIHPSGEEMSKGTLPGTVDTALALKELNEAAGRLVGKFPNITRVAVNCRFSWYFDDLEHCNVALAERLPYNVPIDQLTRDFVFQYNIRTESGGREMNRLVKWLNEPVQIYTGPSNDPTLATLIKEYWVAGIHLDFNSVVPAPIFGSDEVGPFFEAIQKEIVGTLENEMKHT